MAKNVLIVDDAATMQQLVLRGMQLVAVDDACAATRGGTGGTAHGAFDLILHDLPAPAAGSPAKVQPVGPLPKGS